MRIGEKKDETGALFKVTLEVTASAIKIMECLDKVLLQAINKANGPTPDTPTKVEIELPPIPDIRCAYLGAALFRGRMRDRLGDTLDKLEPILKDFKSAEAPKSAVDSKKEG